ncbi:hypothetical protein Tco_1199537, partial [Tanacetum coccineum]
LEHDLQKTKKTYSSAFTKLILRVKKLEKQVKTGKARRRAKIVLYEDEATADDSSKYRRKIFDINEDPNIFLAQDEGVIWIHDETPTEVMQDQGSGEKVQPEVTTAHATLDTAGIKIKVEEAVKQEERLSYEEAIRLQEHDDEEKRKQIARDAEIAR